MDCLSGARCLALAGVLLSAVVWARPQRPRSYQAHVTGDRTLQAASDRAVDARLLQLTSRRSGDDLLRHVPGLLLSRHGAEGKGVQIFLRGFDAAHGADVEVLCQGIPLNELSHVHGQGYLDLGFVIPEVVRTLQVRKGASELAQGPFATAGSVRLELGVPAPRRGGRLSYEVGSTLRHRILLLQAPPTEPEEVFAAAEALRDQGYGPNRHSERVSLLAQGRPWTGGPSARLTALVSAYGARFGGPAPLPLADYTSGRAGFYDTYSRNTGGTSARVLASLRLVAHGPAGELEATGYALWRRLVLRENFTGYLLYPERGDRRLQFHQAEGGGMRVGYERRLGVGLWLQAGASAHLEQMGQYEDQVDEQDRAWQRNRDLTGLQLHVAAHGGLLWQPLPWLRLVGGARLDLLHLSVLERVGAGRRAADRFVHLAPRLRTLVSLPRGVQLVAAYGRGLRPPEARSLLGSGVIETAELGEYQGRAAEMATADSVEAGLRVRLPVPVVLSAAGFVTVLEREVLFDHVAAVNVALSGTRRLGGELAVEAEPWPWLQLRLDATAVDARFADSGNPVPGAPRLLATLVGVLEHPVGVHAGLRLLGLAPRPLRHGATAGGAILVDLLLGYRWRQLQADLIVDNLLHLAYREGEFQYPSAFDRAGPRSTLPALHFSPAPPLMARGQLTLWL
ncbi:MAG: TonB-dependent receptor [Myxococcota bacterium]|nr:TonB-dependent receptor [Myxococcota bacterium]